MRENLIKIITIDNIFAKVFFEQFCMKSLNLENS